MNFETANANLGAHHYALFTRLAIFDGFDDNLRNRFRFLKPDLAAADRVEFASTLIGIFLR